MDVLSVWVYFKGISRLQAEPRGGKSSSAEVSRGHDEAHSQVDPANGIFMSGSALVTPAQGWING